EGARWKLPVYSDASGQLDGSIFYRINDNLQVGLEMNNLTNEETRTIMKQNSDGAGDHYASYFVNDSRYARTLCAIFGLVREVSLRRRRRCRGFPGCCLRCCLIIPASGQPQVSRMQ